MSHHYSGPDLGFPHGDARLDITDLFVFPSHDNAQKSILILNVHPSVSLDKLKSTRPDPFASDALYEFKIDTNGDAVADIAWRIRFSPFVNGEQTATLRYIEGSRAAATGDGGDIIMDRAPVSMGREALVTEAGDYRLFAGWRSDPFFFDPLGAVNNFQFTGKDFFTDKDVCAIALEVPNTALGAGEVGLWVRTLDGTGGLWVQADRGARPSQSIFLTGDERNAYLAAEPVDDARFIPVFAHSLEHTGGFTPEAARRVATTLLPDIMQFDHNRPVAYPDNGRTLTDDVLDHFLSVITNGKVTTDGISAHTDLLGDFPYLGPPHRAAASGSATVR